MHVNHDCSIRNNRQWSSIVLNAPAVMMLLFCVSGSQADSDPGSAQPSLSHVIRIGDWSFNDVRSVTAHLRTSGRSGKTISFIAPRSDDQNKNYRFKIRCNKSGEVLNIDVSDLGFTSKSEGVVAQFAFKSKTFDLYIDGGRPRSSGAIDAFFEEQEIKSTDIEDFIYTLYNSDKFVLTVDGDIKPTVYTYQLSGTSDAVDRLNHSCTENQS